MKFRIASDELTKAISRASSLPGSKLLTTCPVVLGVGFEGMTLGRLSPIAALETEAEAEVLDGTPIFLDFTSLEKVAGKMAKEQVVEGWVDQRDFVLKWGSARARLAILPSDIVGIHRPPQLEVTYKKRFVAHDLMTAFEVTTPAASKLEIEQRLTGIGIVNMLGGLTFFATDRKRFHCFISKGETEPVSCLLPTEAAQTALKFLEENDNVSTLEVGQNALRITSGPTTFTSALSKADPMVWKEDYFDTEPTNEATLSSEDFLRALRSVSPLGWGDLCMVGLEFLSKEIELSADTRQGSSIELRVPAKVSKKGAPKIFFNAQFLIELVEASGGKEITLKHMDSIKSIFIGQPDRILNLMLINPDSAEKFKAQAAK